jgi:hypothetical protein
MCPADKHLHGPGPKALAFLVPVNCSCMSSVLSTGPAPNFQLRDARWRMAILLWGLAPTTATTREQTARLRQQQRRWPWAQKCVTDWLACCIVVRMGVADICKCPAWMLHCQQFLAALTMQAVLTL